jgi:hypothetical protein
MDSLPPPQNKYLVVIYDEVGARKMELSEIRKQTGSNYGENIAAGYSTSGDAVKGWFDEVSKYDYSNPGFSEGTGHYTQIVWKGTGAVGCAAAYCDGIVGPGKSWFVDIPPPPDITSLT